MWDATWGITWGLMWAMWDGTWLAHEVCVGEGWGPGPGLGMLAGIQTVGLRCCCDAAAALEGVAWAMLLHTRVCVCVRLCCMCVLALVWLCLFLVMQKPWMRG